MFNFRGNEEACNSQAGELHGLVLEPKDQVGEVPVGDADREIKGFDLVMFNLV